MINFHFRAFALCLMLGLFSMADSTSPVFAQRPGTHADESKVPTFTLPDPLTCLDGSKVASAQQWEQKRRPEVLQLFADHVYGNVPDRKVSVVVTQGKTWEALDGQAIRKEVRFRFGDLDDNTSGIKATLLLTLPKSEKPVACFLGYNFHGNHTTTDDPQVSIPTSWVRNKKSLAKNNRALEKGRGTGVSRWPYKEIIKSGYGVGTMYYGDIDPDHDDQFQNGIHPLFYADGQSKPSARQWGSIGAWAWALSRVLDYLETDEAIDGNRVAVIGHSRLGKTALWAGASDQRFWITISNCSGCGGAALNRRAFGETVKVINTSFPHWFNDQYAIYNGKEGDLPIDQHMLIALLAPRPVYVASATEDLWADPKGEFLSLANANGVYSLYDNPPMPRESPRADTPLVRGCLGYHLRAGKHDITVYDWQQYLKFADAVGNNIRESLKRK